MAALKENENLLDLIANLDIEKAVRLDLSHNEKEFLYFDKNLKTGKWRLSYTKRTI